MYTVIPKFKPNNDFGLNIQKLRHRKKLTQDMVIAQMQLLGFNITRSTYAKIESNRRSIYVSELIALKQIFDVEYNDFFDGLTIEEP